MEVAREKTVTSEKGHIKESNKETEEKKRNQRKKGKGKKLNVTSEKEGKQKKWI